MKVLIFGAVFIFVLIPESHQVDLPLQNKKAGEYHSIIIIIIIITIFQQWKFFWE